MVSAWTSSRMTRLQVGDIGDGAAPPRGKCGLGDGENLNIRIGTAIKALAIFETFL